MSILSVQDISKSYKLRQVVKSLSVEIKSGEVVGLLGPNGAGKTTAFYMIVGLVGATSAKAPRPWPTRWPATRPRAPSRS